jgi:hypothetical protein
MAIHFFSGGWRREGSKRLLFQGTANESRFRKWLRELVKELKDHLEVIRLLSFEIGTHSFRKGVATFVVLHRPRGGSNPRPSHKSDDALTSRPRRHWYMSTTEMSV